MFVLESFNLYFGALLLYYREKKKKKNLHIPSFSNIFSLSLESVPVHSLNIYRDG